MYSRDGLHDLVRRLRVLARQKGTRTFTSILGYIGVYGYILKNADVEVRVHETNDMVEIERLENGNPVLMMNEKGEIIRTHGEMRFVEEALEALLIA